MVYVLDPTAELGADTADPGPDLTALTGARVGLRVDILWRSWDWITDEWAKLLEADGATVIIWRARGRTGDEGIQMLDELDDFSKRIDAAIVGLGNCGSCTSWTIHDALRIADRDVPTVAATTAHFTELGHTLARRGGRSALRIETLPYPLDTLPEEQVRDIARQQYRSVVRTLGVRA